MRSLHALTGFSAAFLFALPNLFAQANYTGANVTGQLLLTRTVNLLQQAQLPPGALGPVRPEARPEMPEKLVGPSVLGPTLTLPSMPSLMVSSTFTGTGFNGLTHFEQRAANGNTQFTSVEPPSPSIAVGNGLVLEGVNNAIQVYSAAGAPLLPQAVSTSRVFGLAPIYNPSTNIRGPRLTDMRVFYDQGISRWIILQRSRDTNSSGVFLNQSHLYMAVSQSTDPIGTYNIYVMDSTNADNPGCPCFPDYPQIGADQYGIHISSNEFSTFFNQFLDVAILSISKTSLALGALVPTTYRVIARRSTGYEYTLHPAITPPGASYFLASNGLEYFVSSVLSSGNTVAIWALSNTGSLETTLPVLKLSVAVAPTVEYLTPNSATQRPGPLPYGSTLNPPGLLSRIDGNDSRILSVSYAGGRLYATWATQVIDEAGRQLVGGAYGIFSPSFRNGVLASLTLRGGYLLVNNNHLLRPAIAVNAQGQGAIVATLVGPDYFPSAAFLPISAFSTATTLQVAGPGAAPEDGFTGYPDIGFQSVGIARWGDYSTAVVGSDGSAWMVTEYIPNAPRSDFANWGTFLIRYAQ